MERSAPPELRSLLLNTLLSCAPEGHQLLLQGPAVPSHQQPRQSLEVEEAAAKPHQTSQIFECKSPAQYQHDQSCCVPVEVKKLNKALDEIPVLELRGVTCHMGSHSVTCHPTQVNAAHLNPSSDGQLTKKI